MRKDKAEQININWNTYGKVEAIYSYSGSGNDIDFVYDASGNRVAKRITPDGSTNDDALETVYIRDASGNVMATYENTFDGSDVTTQLTERHIYGSSRVGIIDKDVILGTRCYGPHCASTLSFGVTTGGGSSTIDLAITEVLYESPLELVAGGRRACRRVCNPL